MCRKEFFELLMRIAPTEYPDYDHIEALDDFLKVNVMKNI